MIPIGSMTMHLRIKVNFTAFRLQESVSEGMVNYFLKLWNNYGNYNNILNIIILEKYKNIGDIKLNG